MGATLVGPLMPAMNGIASKPPLVVHVVHYLVIGGVENGVVNIVNRLSNGVRHAIVCMATQGVFRERVNPATPVFSLEKSTGHDIRAFGRLVRLFRTLKPDIVHTRNWGTFDGVLAAKIARVPVVLHGEHGREVADPDGSNRRRKHLRRLFMPLIDRFVTVSHDLHRWLVDDVGIRPAKVVTIHNGVDTDVFAPGDRRSLRAQLGLPVDVTLVGSVGRLNPVKDHATLIRAFAEVHATQPSTRLVIVGDGPCRDDLRQLVRDLMLDDSVLLLGARYDVPTILRSFDVFVLPSIAEGISNTILEAMATGLPIVATAVGGNPELVVPGTNGALVPRAKPSAMAKAIAAYAHDLSVRLAHGRASRQRVLDHFALEHMCDNYARLYLGFGGGANTLAASSLTRHGTAQ